MEEKNMELEERLKVLANEFKEYIESNGSGEYGLVLAACVPLGGNNLKQVGYTIGSGPAIVAALAGLWEDEKSRLLLNVANEYVFSKKKEES